MSRLFAILVNSAALGIWQMLSTPKPKHMCSHLATREAEVNFHRREAELSLSPVWLQLAEIVDIFRLLLIGCAPAFLLRDAHMHSAYLPS